MKITPHRLIASIAIAILSVFFLFSHLKREKARQERDLAINSALLGDSLQESIEPALQSHSDGRLQNIAEKFGHRGRLVGIAVYDLNQKPVVVTQTLQSSIVSVPSAVQNCLTQDKIKSGFEKIGKRTLFVHCVPLHSGPTTIGALALFNDTTYIENRISGILQSNIKRAAIQLSLFGFLVLTLPKLLEWLSGFLNS